MAVRKEFEEPRALSLEEALGTDDEAIREKMALRLLQGDEILRSEIEAEKKELKELEDELERSVIAYERDDSNREPVERAYEKKLGILHRIAGQAHPLSDEGKEALREAAACRKEFETLIGPILTTITKNNINLFQTVLPEDIGEDVSCGRRSALGAIRTDKGRTYGVGAIVYYTDQVPTYDGGVLRIEWLYVHERFRKRGVARFLLGELLHQMIRSGLPAVSCEFPAKGEYNRVLAYILSGWSFEFGTWISPEALIRIGDITGYSQISAMKKGAQSWSSLDGKMQELLKAKAYRKFGCQSWFSKVSPEYIDRDTSCYLGSPGDIKALLLSHKTPSGMLRLEYLRFMKGQEESGTRLISLFLEKASLANEDDTLIMVPVEQEEIGMFLQKICPGQMGQYMVEGVLEVER